MMNEKTVIYIDHVTKDYGQGRGNFDVTLELLLFAMKENGTKW